MNGWEITAVSAHGGTSSEATIIVRNSPSMVVNVTTNGNSTDLAVQLPISPVIGDFVEVCVGSTTYSASIWLGTTVLNSSTTHYDAVETGKCRSYRYISGPLWNRYD